MCFSLVLTGSTSLWHFKVRVISGHQGNVNLSVFQSQGHFPVASATTISAIPVPLKPLVNSGSTANTGHWPSRPPCSFIFQIFPQRSLQACLKHKAFVCHFQIQARRNLLLLLLLFNFQYQKGVSLLFLN